MKPYTLTEYEECIILFDYLSLLQNKGKIILFTHIPNSTYTPSWNQKRRNKRMGVSAGVPDYMIITKKKLLFIEMKREKGGVISEEQNMWIDGLNSVKGVFASVARGFDEAKNIVDNNI